MNTLNNMAFKAAASLLLFFSACIVANGQKLPNVQQGSVRAPEGIKIDGKTTEWDNTFKAYNHATDIYYTISNNDSHLYLTIQATDPVIINKIIGAGITFTIQKSGKKSDKDAISITYPIFDKKNRPYLSGGLKSQFSSLGGDVTVVTVRRSGDAASTGPEKTTGDSLMKVNNKRLADNSKYIGVTGIKDLDTLVSVYNEDGIKTAEQFNTQMAYTYELAIDLKHLGLSTGSPAKFAYHLTINGSSMFKIDNVKITGGDGSAASSAAAAEATERIMAKLNAMGGGSSSPTDFWGEYTLAKK